jgi:hypothetical protein
MLIGAFLFKSFEKELMAGDSTDASAIFKEKTKYFLSFEQLYEVTLTKEIMYMRLN